MKRNYFLSLIIGIILLNAQLIFATGDPVISLSPSNGTTYEGGINGYGKTVNISYEVSGLESCWWQGDYLGFEVWLYIDGVQAAYHRDSERHPVGNHYGLTYSNSLSQYLSQGSHSIKVVAKNFEVKFDLYLDTDEASTTNTIYITPPPSITVDNNFTDQSGSTHGVVIVSDYGYRTVPFQFEKNSGQSVSLAAVSPQTDNQNYQRIWHNGSENQSRWLKDYQFVNSSQSFTFAVTTSDNNSTYQAQLRKLYNLTFSNPGHVITLDGNNYTSSASASVVEENTVTASAQNYSASGIDYTFQYWSSGGSNFGTTITATENKTYTATYSAKPNINNRALTFSSNQQNAIILSWGVHPTCTIYRVYRKVGKTNPTMSLLATTSALSFTDPDYINTGNMDDEWLQYDVRPVYNDVESDPSWEGPIFGLIWAAKNENIESIDVAKEIPSEYSFGNYPNPFNPETTINYQLPVKSFVAIKIYDILGKEVAELVNENKSAGYYQVKFDGSRLTSGIYVAAIQANNFSKSIKLLLTK